MAGSSQLSPVPQRKSFLPCVHGIRSPAVSDIFCVLFRKFQEVMDMFHGGSQFPDNNSAPGIGFPVLPCLHQRADAGSFVKWHSLFRNLHLAGIGNFQDRVWYAVCDSVQRQAAGSGINQIYACVFILIGTLNMGMPCSSQYLLCCSILLNCSSRISQSSNPRRSAGDSTSAMCQ